MASTWLGCTQEQGFLWAGHRPGQAAGSVRPLLASGPPGGRSTRWRSSLHRPEGSRRRGWAHRPPRLHVQAQSWGTPRDSKAQDCQQEASTASSRRGPGEAGAADAGGRRCCAERRARVPPDLTVGMKVDMDSSFPIS